MGDEGAEDLRGDAGRVRISSTYSKVGRQPNSPRGVREADAKRGRR